MGHSVDACRFARFHVFKAVKGDIFCGMHELASTK